MEAIQRGLVSREMLRQMSGIKTIRTNVLPANSSGNYQYTATGNNKITFQIPSFPNSYINTKRSFIRFKLATNDASAIIAGGAPVFRRMLLKNARGQVLEDIDNYDVLCRLYQNMKTEAELKGKANNTADYRALNDAKSYTTFGGYSTGRTVVHNLLRVSLASSKSISFP